MRHPKHLTDFRTNRRASLVVGIAACGVLALSATALASLGPAALAAVGLRAEPAAATATSADSPTLVPIYVTPSGFEPNEIQLSTGPHIFVIRNRTGVVDKDVHVKITLPNGTEIIGDPVGHTRDAVRPVDLVPGTYLVSVPEVADRPEWQIRITVE
jgi:hypothetical protein